MADTSRGGTLLGESPPDHTPDLGLGLIYGRLPSASTSSLDLPKAGSKLQQMTSKLKGLRRNVKPPVTVTHSPSLPAAPEASGVSAPPAPSTRNFVEASEHSDGPAHSRSNSSAPTMPPVDASSGFSIRKGSAGIEEFNPKASHPSNPLAPIAPLLTKMMRPLTEPSKALMARARGRYVAAAMPAPPSPLPPSKFDGTPPMGYLWLWMGGFLRWRRRFFVASEAPGVVLIYKRMNMKGKVWSISLRNATIHEDDQDPRQLKILTPSGLIFLRAVDGEERDKWCRCLSHSIAMYLEKQQLVEGLQEQGLLPPLALKPLKSMSKSIRLATMHEGSATIGGSGGGGLAAGAMDGVGVGPIKLLPNGEVADMDVEQRKKIRLRVGEKLSEITPYQLEVEHHMNLLSTQLLGVVSALNIRVGVLTPATSNVRLAHYVANTQASPLANAVAVGAGSQLTTRPSLQSVPSASSLKWESDGQEIRKEEGEAGPAAEAAAAAGGASYSPRAPAPAAALGYSSAAGAAAAASSPASASPLKALSDDGPAAEAGASGPAPPASSAPLHTRAAGGMFRSHMARLPNGRPLTLQQAYGQLLEAFRNILHGESVRIAQLEAENQALHRTLQVMKAAEARRLKATRSGGGGGGVGGGASANSLHASSSSAAGASPTGRGGRTFVDPATGELRTSSSNLHRTASDVSALTADEDAFDVLEPFDDSVNYAILDDPGYGSLQSDGVGGPSEQAGAGTSAGGGAAGGAAGAGAVAAAAVAQRRRPRVRIAETDQYNGTTTEHEDEDEVPPSPTGDEGVEEDDDDDDDEEEVRQEAEVLQALEVVRQVHYVEQSPCARLAMIATQAPPLSGPEEQLRDATTGDADDDDSDDDEECEEEEEEDAPAPCGAAGAGVGPIAAAAGAHSGGGASAGGRGLARVSNQLGGTSMQRRQVRTRLPAAKPLGRGFSVWSVLKDMIGKDLTRITMPATINEPLTFLQRLAESFEYHSLLDKVSTTQDSTTRMMMVAVWQLSCYNSQPLREGKPFNPLLGETYEWQAPDGSVKYLCEQVSHHPPVSAYHAQGGLHSRHPWEVQGEFEVKTKFWGKSIELLMLGCEALRVPSFDEEYRWNKATVCVNDLIFGNFYADIYGKIKIVNRKTGDSAVLNLRPCRGRKEKRGEFDGLVYDGKGKEVYRLFGSTMDKVYAAFVPAYAAARGVSAEPVLMWQKQPYPEDSEVQYNFTKFAIALNDPGDAIVPYLPPTDARFRPDQRALEVGEFARATTEKLRLEEKQRQARRKLAESGQEYRPCWFSGPPPHAPHSRTKAALTKSMEENGFVWSFTGDYWKKREVKDWSGCPDLY